VLLLLSFWKNWLMTSWIVVYLILDVVCCNIYLAFLYIKSLKSRWVFQLLIHFFKNLFFSIAKASWKVSSLFQHLAFQLKKLAEKNEQTDPRYDVDESGKKMINLIYVSFTSFYTLCETFGTLVWKVLTRPASQDFSLLVNHVNQRLPSR
jgi:hypothetical protein